MLPGFITDHRQPKGEHNMGEVAIDASWDRRRRVRARGCEHADHKHDEGSVISRCG